MSIATSTAPAWVRRVLSTPAVAAAVTKAATESNWLGRCPCHDDAQESLSFLLREDGRLSIKCFAGCEPGAVLKALGLTVADLEPPLTLAAFAQAKGLRVETLKRLNVEERPQGGLRFPYFDAAGNRLPRYRVRFSMATKGVWDVEHKGEDTSEYLYGVQLAGSPERLVIVEGESDTATLVEVGVPAVGLPGASRTKNISAALVENVEQLVAVKEPDAGGEAFVRGLRARLKALGWGGQLLVIEPPDGSKDVNDWYRRDPQAFLPEFEAAVGAAKPTKVGKPPSFRPSTTFAQTDLGNAEFVASRYASDLRYDEDRGIWFAWEGHRWQADKGGLRAARIVQQAARLRLAEAQDLDDVQARQRAQLHATYSENAARLAACERLARSQPVFLVRRGGDTWDADPWLLGAPNGVIDLRTGTLRDGRQEDYITRQVAVPFDPSATCPTWERAVRNIFQGDDDLVGFVHRSLGYAITGDTGEQVFWIAYGIGGNGKTSLLETCVEVLGEYAHVIPFETLRAAKGEQHPTEVAQLVGKRLIASLEFEGKARLNETRLKALSGGDRQRARFMREDSFEFLPVGKLWIATNNRPTIRDTSRGFWRRLLFVPFEAVFEKNPKFLPLLKAEKPGILAWLVRGCVEYQRLGLCPPASVRAATDELREIADQIAAFLGATCVIDPAAFEARSRLWAEYERWALDAVDDDRRYKRNAFFAELRERFRETALAGVRGFRGLRLRADDEPPKGRIEVQNCTSKPAPEGSGAVSKPDHEKERCSSLGESAPQLSSTLGCTYEFDGAIPNPIVGSPQNRPSGGGTVSTCTNCTNPPSEGGELPVGGSWRSLSGADLDAFVDGCPDGATLALDTETTSLDPAVADLVGVSLAASASGGVWLSVEQLGLDGVLAALRALDAKGVEFAVWNAAYDLPVLRRAGIVLDPERVVDVMVLRQLSRAGRPGGDGLKDTAKELLDVEPVTYDEAVAGDALAPYAVADAVMTFRLFELLRRAGVPEALRRTEQSVALVVQAATARPWLVDATRAEADLTVAVERERALAGILRGALGEINLASPKQLAGALVGAGVQLTDRTPSGQLATDDEALGRIAHPLVGDLLTYRRLVKAIKTGRTLAEAGPLVRFRVRPLATDTGRMAGGGGGKDGTVKLNPQAFPKPERVPEGFPNLRAWLSPPDPEQLVLSVDLSQVEPRIAASLSGDARLIAAFTSGGDPYQTIADALGIKRSVAKMVWLAVAYGAGAAGLAAKTGLPVERMRELVSGLYEAFPGVRRWKAEVEARAEADGQLTNPFGRVRRFRSGAFYGTQAANTLIQGTAADIFKLGVLAVEAALDPAVAQLALFIHDEVVLFVHLAAVYDTAQRVVRAMTSVAPPDWPVPLAAEAAVGPTLGELKGVEPCAYSRVTSAQR